MQKPMKVLVIDDERNIARTVAMTLEGEGHEVVATESGAGALRQLQKSAFDLAFLDLRLGGGEDGLDVLARLRAADSALAVVVITAHASVPTAVEAMRRGAVDYLPKPFTPAQVRLAAERVSRVRGLEGRVAELESLAATQLPATELESEEPAVRRVLELAFKAAASPHASLLLLGENGTGKSVLARVLHRRSPRAERPIVTVSCPSLSRELLESELFGHVKGAFTGATADTRGKVAAAAGGTLYLDEIGELPPAIQPKLLRLLQEREYERVGEIETRRADVRVISSTNRDLAKAIAAGTFREDLLYRLNTITLTLPPLRERPRDLRRLAEAHLRLFAAQMGKRMDAFAPDALAAMGRYAWPGNLRELRNVVESVVILGNGPRVEASDLPGELRAAGAAAAAAVEVGGEVTLAALGDEHVRRVLARSPRLEDAANVLGIDPATLYRRRRQMENGGGI